MTGTPMEKLSELGVSVWLDDLSRERLRSGSLQRLVDESGVVGVTTNPTIFANALKNGEAYTEQVRELAVAGSDSAAVEAAVFEITTRDVAAAAELLAPIAERTNGEDGKVSIEVDPRLARDAEGTVAMAKRIWEKIGRDNVHIKIPATPEGIIAIREATAAGLSINATLIFDFRRYREVAEAYRDGLEQAAEAGIDLKGVHSVASIFIARVDALIDPQLDANGSPEATALRGTVAITNARAAYAAHEDVFSGERWALLAARGAHPQRPLWASTAVRDPEFSDTLYVTALAYPGSVNTMPEVTLQAVVDHGDFGVAAPAIVPDAGEKLRAQLAALGIDFDDATQRLEDEGVSGFEQSWAELLATVQRALDDAVE